MKITAKNAAKAAALVGIMAACLECSKFALAALPNIEVVTLLCAVFGYVFGPLGALSAIIFVMIEPLIWGFGTWIITYLIYWPLVALFFAVLRRFRVWNRIVPTICAVLLTVFFSVLSSLIDVGLFSGYFDNFLTRFSIYYLRGITFYLLQIGTNAIVFPILFLPLCSLLFKVKKKSFGE